LKVKNNLYLDILGFGIHTFNSPLPFAQKKQIYYFKKKAYRNEID